MAKKRSYKGYRKLQFFSAVDLTSLAEDDVTTQTVGQTMTEERRILSAEVTAALDGMTAGEGPVEVGVAHSDYTAAEIEECLESIGAWDEGNLVALEQSKRLVRSFGILTADNPMLNNGNPKKIRLNWRIASGDGIVLWARSLKGTITGGTAELQGHLHTVLA